MLIKISDTVFTYKFVDMLKDLGIASLVRLKKYQLSILFFLKSLLLYGFQIIREKETIWNGENSSPTSSKGKRRSFRGIVEPRNK